MHSPARLTGDGCRSICKIKATGCWHQGSGVTRSGLCDMHASAFFLEISELLNVLAHASRLSLSLLPAGVYEKGMAESNSV